MRKKLLPIVVVAIVAVSIVVAGSLLHWWGQEPSNGGIPEEPSNNQTTPEPEIPPVTPYTLTVLSLSEGTVFVMKAGTANWTEAQVGMTLEPGDVVKSGDDSSAEITFFDGSIIELEAGTQIEVVSLAISQAGSTTIKLRQAIGNTISRVTKLVDAASSYEVETPACVAAVRGSRMPVNVIADGTTWVTNEEGKICVTAQGVELCLRKGQKCIIIPGQPPQFVPTTRGGGGGGGGGGPSPRPDIEITKTANATQVHDGDIITYTYTVTNPGNVALSNVSITDDMIEEIIYESGDTDDDGRLDTDETWIFTASYYVTVEDPSPLVNNAAAAGTYAAQTIIDWAEASVDILRPAIAMNKIGELVWNDEGFYSSINYTYTITNPGNTPLSAISVIDDKIEEQEGEVTYQSGDDDNYSWLDTDETWIFTATYWIGEEYGEAVTNNATAYGTDALNMTVTAEASASVDILQPAIYLEKTGESWENSQEEAWCINYTYNVTNLGNTPLRDISVSDNMTEEVTPASGDTNENELLDVGEAWIFTATYCIPYEYYGEYVTNSATAYGTDPLGHTVTAEATLSISNPYHYYY